MNVFPVRTDEELRKALERIDELWGASVGTPEGDELDVMLTLAESYEARHHPIPPGSPSVIVGYKLKELGMSQEELGRQLGWPEDLVSKLLLGRLELDVFVIRKLVKILDIPGGLLLGEETWAKGGEEDG